MRGWVRGAEASSAFLWLIGLVLPLGLFFERSLSLETASTLATATVRAAILNSFYLMACTSIFGTLGAFVFSWLLWRFEWGPKKSRALTLILKAPYLLPPFFFAMGWIALAAPSVGYINQLALGAGLPPLPSIYGIAGTAFVLTLWSIALAMIQLQAFFSQLPGNLEDAAVMCGASPSVAFFKITLPLARPYLVSCGLLVSVNALAAFGVPALLGAPERSYVITTKIYQSIKSSSDFSHAGGLSLLLLAMTLALLSFQRWILRKNLNSALVSGKASRPATLEPGIGAKLGFAALCFFALGTSLLPCVALALQSFLRDRADATSLSFDKYIYVYTQIPDTLVALKNSLAASSIAAALATVTGIVIAYGATRLRLRISQWLIEAWNIGYALPGTVIALSLLMFFSGSLTDTIWVLSLAYLLKYAAFSLRTLAPAMASVSKELEEACWMSGASPVQGFLRILVPLLKPALAASILLSLVPMVSELTMSILLVGTGTETLGALIYRLQEYADPGAAAVLAVSTAAATLLLNAALRKLSKGSFGI